MNENNLLSIEQAVNEFDLKKPTLLNLCRKGKLPFIKKNRSYFLMRKDIEKYISTKKK